MLRGDRKPIREHWRVQFYHAIALRSRKKAPVGPLSGAVASHTTVSAPFSTVRVAPRPPMPVCTQPGSTEFTRIPIPSDSAAVTRVTTLIPAFDNLYAMYPAPISANEPIPLERLTIRP